jgi:hypothetical protein
MTSRMVQSCGHYKDNSFVSMENFLHSGEVGMPRCQPGAVSVLGAVNGEVRMWEEISTLRSQPGPLRILGVSVHSGPIQGLLVNLGNSASSRWGSGCGSDSSLWSPGGAANLVRQD